jgi:hypothetical protein
MSVSAEFDNVDSVKHALELSGAVAFLPLSAISEELSSGTLVALDCDWLKLHSPLGVIQRRDTSLGRTARALHEMLFRQVSQDVLETQDDLQSQDGDATQDGDAALGHRMSEPEQVRGFEGTDTSLSSDVANSATDGMAQAQRLEPGRAARSTTRPAGQSRLGQPRVGNRGARRPVKLSKKR